MEIDVDSDEKYILLDKKTTPARRHLPEQVKARGLLAGRVVMGLVVFVIGSAMLLGVANTHHKHIFYETLATIENHGKTTTEIIENSIEEGQTMLEKVLPSVNKSDFIINSTSEDEI